MLKSMGTFLVMFFKAEILAVLESLGMILRQEF